MKPLRALFLIAILISGSFIAMAGPRPADGQAMIRNVPKNLDIQSQAIMIQIIRYPDYPIMIVSDFIKMNKTDDPVIVGQIETMNRSGQRNTSGESFSGMIYILEHG